MLLKVFLELARQKDILKKVIALKPLGQESQEISRAQCQEH